MSKPLTGLLVVSLEQAVAAPFCSAKFADAGARVIKVERAEGDFARGYDKFVNGLSSYFVWLNRGKESLVLDIKEEADAALLHRILAKADVFVQNLAPGAAARAGFGSAELRERHPRLVTCDISGYGEDGPYREMKAYDLLVQVESGLAAVTGTPEAPGRVGVSICDISTGLTAYSAILEALNARAQSGRGSGVQVSLFDTIVDWMSPLLLQYLYAGNVTPRVGISHHSIAPYGAYQTKGAPVVISIQNEREWRAFCEGVLERPELARDAALREPRRARAEPRGARRRDRQGLRLARARGPHRAAQALRHRLRHAQLDRDGEPPSPAPARHGRKRGGCARPHRTTRAAPRRARQLPRQGPRTRRAQPSDPTRVRRRLADRYTR